MKVSVYQTVEITDEQRKEISKLLGVKQASRDQMKDFLWKHGENWATVLNGSTAPAALAAVPDVAELEDLI